MKALTKLGLVLTIAGMGVLNAGCWEIALAVALADNDSTTDVDPYYYDEPYYYDDPYYYEPYTEVTVDVRNQGIQGNLGPVRGFEGNIWQEQGYQYGGVATLQVDARSYPENWAVMAALTVEGGLDHPDLVPGAILTFSGYDYTYGSDRLYISLLGCSGEADGYWDFDVTADEVTVQVSESDTPGYLRLDYTGTWSDGSTVQGTVDYQLR